MVFGNLYWRWISLRQRKSRGDADVSTHRCQGKVSAVSWSSHDGLEMDAETPSAFSIFKLKATTRENMSKLIMSWKEHLTYAFFDIFQGGVHAVFP